MLPKAQAFLRDRNMTFIVEPQGALLQRTVPVLNPPHPEDLREDFADLVHQIANSYEMTCIAVPSRKVEAQETWEVRVPLLKQDRQLVSRRRGGSMRVRRVGKRLKMFWRRSAPSHPPWFRHE